MWVAFERHFVSFRVLSYSFLVHTYHPNRCGKSLPWEFIKKLGWWQFSKMGCLSFFLMQNLPTTLLTCQQILTILISLTNQSNVSMDVEQFAVHIKIIHDQVGEQSRHIIKSLKKVILSWFIFKKKKNPSKTYNKCKQKKIEPCWVTKKFGSNALSHWATEWVSN